jgi:hypothetical protein
MINSQNSLYIRLHLAPQGHPLRFRVAIVSSEEIPIQNPRHDDHRTQNLFGIAEAHLKLTMDLLEDAMQRLSEG